MREMRLYAEVLAAHGEEAKAKLRQDSLAWKDFAAELENLRRVRGVGYASQLLDSDFEGTFEPPDRDKGLSGMEGVMTTEAEVSVCKEYPPPRPGQLAALIDDPITKNVPAIYPY
jgi:hypothetical protein